MIFKLRIKSWQASLALTRLTTVVGVNSNLPDGRHILMWDFDKVNLSDVKYALAEVQEQYGLPPIYVLNTGTPDHYIAYCFEPFTWIQSVSIIAATKFIDQNYFRLAVIRKHWTLRISDKDGRKIIRVCVLPSWVKEYVDYSYLKNFVEYDTMKKNWPKKVITIGRG